MAVLGFGEARNTSRVTPGEGAANARAAPAASQ
jgi:hypothetical protein